MSTRVQINKYVRDDVIVDAAEFHDCIDPDGIVNWINSESTTQKARFEGAWNAIIIETSEYDMRVKRCAWVIREPDGTFHPCRSDSFRDIYRPVILREFVKIPATVKAMQFTKESLTHIPIWVNYNSEGYPVKCNLRDRTIHFITPEGKRYLNLTDWVVMNEDGSFSIYSDGEFKKMYKEKE